MKNLIIIGCVVLCSYGKSHSKINFNSEPKTKFELIEKNNYKYFSDILLYPLRVNTEFNIENGGRNKFIVSIYNSDMILVVTLNSSPYCSTKLNLDSFADGRYIVKVSSSEDVHQFEILKGDIKN